jgi:hypothetical protein
MRNLPGILAAKTMKGTDGHAGVELPHDQLRATLKKYNRLAQCTQLSFRSFISLRHGQA